MAVWRRLLYIIVQLQLVCSSGLIVYQLVVYVLPMS